MIELENDPHGLLEIEAEGLSTSLPSPLISRFVEICDFVETTGNPPNESSESLMERQLGQWLDTILHRDDLLNLIKAAGWGAPLSRIQAIQSPSLRKESRLVDPFGLLGMVKNSGIQQLRNVSKINRKSPESIAKRQPCKDFSKFEPKFELLAQELENGRIQPLKAVAGKIQPGAFLVINDLLGFVDKVESELSEQEFESGNRLRMDGRTRIIFENGTETNMLLRSLEKALLADGYLLVTKDGLSEPGIELTSGFLYVVKSLREFAGVEGGMLKIGFTRTSVARRLSKARTEAAYLFGDVEVVASYRCLGVDPAALESALHAFFAEVKVDIELNLGANNILKPKEWFGVNLEAIDLAINLALESEIDNYVFDPRTGIVPRNNY